jgi:hypothetical protein
VVQRLEIGTGQTGPEDLARFFSALLLELERAADTEQPEWAMSAVARNEPLLKGADARLLAAIYAAMPTATSGLVDVVSVRGVGRQVPCAQSTCLALNLDVMLDPAGVRRAGFRHLSETIRRWDNLAKAQARIRLPSGADVLHVVVRTDPAGLRLRLVTHEGKIVPVRQGRVAMDEAFALDDLDTELEIEARADVRYEGFSLEVRDLKFPGRLVAGSKKAVFSGRIDQSPSLVLSGTDAVRSSLASFADSTLGLGDHGRDFAAYVADGRNGRGTQLSVAMIRNPDGSNVAVESFDTVLLDNSLIRFAFRVVGGRLIPDERALDEFGSLMEQVVGAMVTDYERVRPRVAATQVDGP